MSDTTTTPEGADDFASMFEQSQKNTPHKRLKVGDSVKGKLLHFGAEWAFLDVGGKGEAMISIAELLDGEGQRTVKEGDLIEGRVTSTQDSALIVSRVLQKGKDARDHLEQAKELGLPVEGLVKGLIKGGLEIDVAGVRAFCPASQMELRYVEDLSVFVGLKFPFVIIEFKEGGRNILVSRRALLEEEQEKRADETRKTLAVGAIFTGRVTSVRDFGAFVDIGGIDGLLHVSEIGHSRTARAADVLKLGQEVEVQVKKIEGDKLSLSMKSLAGDPWKNAAVLFPVGTKHQGIVSRIQPFGAFVELAPGVDGLLHVSNLGDPRIRDPRQVLQEGQEVTVTVVTFDPTQKRIGLALGELAPGEEAPGVGAIIVGKVERIEPYGVFVRIPGPLTAGKPPRGLVPLEELGPTKGDLKREFPIGSDLKVVVLDPDSQGRLRLSHKGATETEERAEASEYMKSTGKTGSAGGSFGTTFADLLKGKK